MKKSLITITSISSVSLLITYFFFPGLLFHLSVFLDRKSASLSPRKIEVANHSISFLEGGKGDTILLLHGFRANKDNWNKFAKSLTSSFHVVAFDLPGFGESSKLETQTYTIDFQVKMLDKIADALALKSFHLVGNSMGGTIAGKYSADFPGKVLSLALFNTGGIYSAEKSDLIKLLEKGENPLLVESVSDFNVLIEFLFNDPIPIPYPIKKYLTKQYILEKKFDEQVFRAILREKYSLEPDLQKIRATTLVVWGEQDRVIHVSCTKILETSLPNSSTVILKGCGHLPMLEQPLETANHYIRFLKMRVLPEFCTNYLLRLEAPSL